MQSWVIPVANMLSASGYEVTREFYINDAGRQMELLGESVFARYRELFGEAAEIPEDGYKGDYVKETASEIRGLKGDSLLRGERNEALAFSREFARENLLGFIGKDLGETGIRFDVWYSEKENIHGSGGGKLGEIKASRSKKGARGKEGASGSPGPDTGIRRTGCW
jgi:arginyl-tRNA synthetase